MVLAVVLCALAYQLGIDNLSRRSQNGQRKGKAVDSRSIPNAISCARPEKIIMLAEAKNSLIDKELDLLFCRFLCKRH